VSDRRAITSRANLGDHIPQALDPNGTTVIATRVPRNTAQLLNEQAQAIGITTAALLRRIIDDHINALM